MAQTNICNEFNVSNTPMSQESQQQHHHQHHHHQQQQKCTETFSIAIRPSASCALPIDDKLSDTSFLHQTNTSSTYHPNEPMDPAHGTDSSLNLILDNVDMAKVSTNHEVNGNSNSNNNDLTSSSSSTSLNDDNTRNQHQAAAAAASAQPDPVQNDDCRPVKKRNKPTKKSAKLDPKSKLEKSRQSARECRARKKLRYQYLEDLVCNREKAVVKLREELATFCKLSKAIDTGEISDKDRQLLLDQIKDKV